MKPDRISKSHPGPRAWSGKRKMGRPRTPEETIALLESRLRGSRQLRHEQEEVIRGLEQELRAERRLRLSGHVSVAEEGGALALAPEPGALALIGDAEAWVPRRSRWARFWRGLNWLLAWAFVGRTNADLLAKR